ncbi:hypothetical protein [Streptomyces atratus]|uniref:Uncharacterized protein n=1 Tax=Streptomyces atratus TaxID=1893 RepID=A0A1K2DU79_STRAR|nr:hypothetical protein [Streptomyces atratus]SFY26280.1 hypothetical protein SAMN02787144_1015124 [Streptomyces atratus]
MRFGRRSGRRAYRSRTRRLLERHLAAMLVTTLVSMSALLVSYREVQISAGEMRDRGAPAVQGVAATQLALLRAHKEAQASVDSGIADVVGAGARYENQLAAADQGLSRLSDVQIDGDRGRGVLETVNGLLTSYSSSITPGAVKYVSDELMQREKFAEAETLLTRRGTGVVPRLDVLQGHQMDRIDTLTSMSPLRWSGWAVAELGLLAMALITLSALWVLRTRCGHSLDLCLLVSLLAVVLLATGPLIATNKTQDQLATARDRLFRIEQQAHDQQARDQQAHDQQARDQQAHDQQDRDQQARELRVLAGAQQAVTDESTKARAGLAAEGWQSGTYYGALAVGALLVLLPAVGIGRHLNADYWRTG